MKAEETSILNVAAAIAAVVWTGIMAGLCLWHITNEKDQTRKLLVFQSRAMFQQVVATRTWNASHGGVYVPVTAGTQPNPYLKASDRDVTTQSGQVLTKINPSYMTREIGEIAAVTHEVWFHITSENPIRPENVPDEWEVRALRSFASKGTEFLGFTAMDGDVGTFRYMAPFGLKSPALSVTQSRGMPGVI